MKISRIYPQSIFLMFFLLTFISMVTGCSSEKGRVSVVLDNSGSMSSTGTSFQEIKQSLLNALILVPDSYEKGLRVFDDRGSRLVSPYHRSLNPLRSTLKDIHPGGGTYIGQSLLDASNDLLENPDGENRLVFITDGEGHESDIQAAQEVKNRLSNLKGDFKCSFILFSKRKNVHTETPIGKVSEILGCDLCVSDDYVSAKSLTMSLQHIFGFDFYWMWIIISALAYIVLLVLTARLIFATQHSQGVLPRYAYISANIFFFSMLLLVLGAHIIGFFAWLTGFVWGLIILALSSLIIAFIGLGKRQHKGKKYDDDPFA